MQCRDCLGGKINNLYTYNLFIKMVAWSRGSQELGGGSGGGGKNQTMVIQLYQGDHEGGNPRGRAGAGPGGLAAAVADSGQRRSRYYPTPLSLQALAKDGQGQMP